MAQILNISVDQGSDYDQILTFKDSTGAAIDITGWTFNGQARTSIAQPDPPAVTFSFVLSPQSGATLGQVVWTVPAVQTDPLGTSVVTLVYDIERTDAGGKKQRLLQGSMVVNPGVTR
jgi:hypothetical protein